MVVGRLQTDVEFFVLGVVVNAGTHVDPRVMDSLPRLFDEVVMLIYDEWPPGARLSGKVPNS
jgi:hypothetical protein